MTKTARQRTGLKNLSLRPVLCAFLFLYAHTVFAQVVINEVQISPTSERFIELYNTDASDIDMMGWYLQRKTATGSSFGSLVSSPNFENKVIKAGGYLLISRSSSGNTDIVLDNLTLTESNTIRIRDSNGDDVDQLEWGSLSDGESYQRTSSSGEWSIGVPTPGVANSSLQGASVLSPDAQSTTVAGTTNTTTTSNFTSLSVTPRIIAQSESIVSGAPVIFLGQAIDSNKKIIEGAQYTWSFGDGETGWGGTVSHVFRYPGTYSVGLTVSTGSGVPIVNTRMKVVATPALLRVTLHDTTSSAIDISNDGAKDIDLSSWIIEGDSRQFTFPEHTMLLAKSTVTLAPETTGFRSPPNSLKILYPNWQPYENPQKEAPAPAQSSTKETPAPVLTATQSLIPTIPVITRDEVIQHPEISSTETTAVLSSSQTASVIGAFEASSQTAINEPQTQEPKEGSMLPWFIGTAFLGAFALLGIRLSRSSENIPQEETTTDSSTEPTADGSAVRPGDDFEILGEGEETDEEPH